MDAVTSASVPQYDSYSHYEDDDYYDDDDEDDFYCIRGIDLYVSLGETGDELCVEIVVFTRIVNRPSRLAIIARILE